MFLMKKNSILHLHSGKSVLKRLALDNYYSQLKSISGYHSTSHRN